jgi:hypothetical protein
VRPDVRAAAPAPLARTSSAATTATRSGSRWLPWLIGAAVVLVLWNVFSGKLASTTALVTVPQAAAPAPTPTAVTVSFPAKVTSTSEAAVSADGSKTIAAVADMIKRTTSRSPSRGTDKTGDVTANEGWPRAATSVRDAQTAGVAEANMEMKPPFFV